MDQLQIIHFTDPTCPFAYSTEPVRWRLRWLYGNQLAWNTKMIVLSGYDGEVPSITPKGISASRLNLRDKHGMPIDATELSRVSQSILACKAYTAVAVHDADNADGLLRQLRVASMASEYIDEQPVIEMVVQKVGIDTQKFTQWLQDPKTEERLTQDAEAARSPGSHAFNMEHKLSKTSTGRVRYSAPSYQFLTSEADEPVFELPGFWPLEAYEAAIGNLLPRATRAKNPTSVTQVLEWAETPLATKEVAVICAKDIDTARKELETVATFKPVGQDGFWALK